MNVISITIMVSFIKAEEGDKSQKGKKETKKEKRKQRTLKYCYNKINFMIRIDLFLFYKKAFFNIMCNKQQINPFHKLIDTLILLELNFEIFNGYSRIIIYY